MDRHHTRGSNCPTATPRSCAAPPRSRCVASKASDRGPPQFPSPRVAHQVARKRRASPGTRQRCVPSVLRRLMCIVPARVDVHQPERTDMPASSGGVLCCRPGLLAVSSDRFAQVEARIVRARPMLEIGVGLLCPLSTRIWPRRRPAHANRPMSWLGRGLEQRRTVDPQHPHALAGAVVSRTMRVGGTTPAGDGVAPSSSRCRRRSTAS